MTNQVETSARLLLGKPVSDAVLSDLKDEISALETDRRKQPGLAVVLIGADPASRAYVGRKKKACAEIGIKSFDYEFPENFGQENLLKLIRELNENTEINGILVQLPLPEGYDSQAVLDLISPEKDVDGFHPMNVGRTLLGLESYRSCTPHGVLALLSYYGIDPEGQHVVIVGRSNIVGKPLAAMLVQKEDMANATVTICHSRSNKLAELTRSADILIAAIGRPAFITGDMVKQDVVVVDVGINRVDDAAEEKGYRLVGDVDFQSVSSKAHALTPVPGGVGPMTIAMLMKNTVNAFKKQHKMSE